VQFSNTKDILKAGRAHLVVITDQVRTGLAGRSRHVMAIAALAGVSALGLVVANVDNGATPSLTAVAGTAAPAVAEQRDNAAERADRAHRPEATAPAQASPSKVAEAAPAPAKTTKAAAPAPAWSLPMPGAEVTSCYGPRWGTQHAGIDFAKPAGTPIDAVGAGTVVVAGWAYTGYGISVVVDHGNGYLTHYAHMSETKVSEGQKVKAGDVLGLEGSTGDSTGPHLHFEVHEGMWNQIEPASWLRERGVDVGC
jgi:murein DD-endopeptidase MepM/ murein hydrolase activator NlpD